MILQEIKEELLSKYSDHEDLQEVLDSLDGEGGSLSYWAGELASESFGNDKKLAKELYEIALEEASSNGDKLSIIVDIVNRLGEKEWAKHLYQELLKSGDDLYLLSSLGASLAKDYKNSDWAREVLSKALEVANITEEKFWGFECVASSIQQSLEDNDWAKKIYMDGLAKFPSVNNYVSAASAAADNFQFNDMRWAKELFLLGQKIAETFVDFKRLADGMGRLVDHHEMSDENDEKIEWAFDNYIVALYLADDTDAKKDIKSGIKELGIKAAGAKQLKESAVKILQKIGKENLIID